MSNPENGAKRTAVAAVSGGVIGALLGILIVSAAWLWVFAQSMNGAAYDLYPFVRSEVHGDAAAAAVGPAGMALPILLLLLGAALGRLLVIRRLRRAPASVQFR